MVAPQRKFGNDWSALSNELSLTTYIQPSDQFIYGLFNY
jgi:hypothetical protein